MTKNGKTHSPKPLWFQYGWIVFAVFLLLSLPACKEDGDSENISEALSNRLTSALNFEGGELKEGEPPEGNDDPTLAPQVEEVRTLTQIIPGQPFSAQLRLNDEFAANGRKKRVLQKLLLEVPPDVDAVIIWVVGSDSYIEVPVDLFKEDDKWWAELFGRLNPDIELQGEQFKLKFAFKSGDVIGEYYDWNLDVTEDPPLEEEEIVETSSIVGGEFFYGSKPAGEFNEASPQIEDIEGPEQLVSGKRFTLILHTDFDFGTNVADVLFSIPLVQGYTIVQGDVFPDGDSFIVSVTNTLTADFAATGWLMTFMVALQSTEGNVGRYRAWSAQVVQEEETLDCDDDNACTTDKVVDGKCEYTTKDCSDGVACTDDQCNPTDASCTNRPARNYCYISGTCYESGRKNPANPCQACNWRNSQEQWSDNDGATCDDNDRCTENDRCSGGTCEGEAKDCTAPNECQVDGSCNATTGECENAFVENGQPCDGGNGTCQGGQCVPASGGVKVRNPQFVGGGGTAKSGGKLLRTTFPAPTVIVPSSSENFTLKSGKVILQTSE